MPKEIIKYTNGEPIKVNHIVVVIAGDARGNSGGTITKVTKVKIPPYHGSHLVCCRSMRAAVADGTAFNEECQTKVKSWFESVKDLRPASPEERKTYYHNFPW